MVKPPTKATENLSTDIQDISIRRLHIQIQNIPSQKNAEPPVF